MASSKKHDKLKKFKITYFVGNYFSSKGAASIIDEEEKTATIIARSEAEAERDFYSMFRGCHLGWIEEI